ncbi:MAG: Maf family protein [Coriobacteriales bacterium]
MDLILASSSPRRRELLQRAGFAFSVLTSSADERYSDGMDPTEVAPFLARQKARAVAASLLAGQLEHSVLVGADTIVALDGTIYGKPADEADARRMLAELSGRTHQVITGVCVIAPGSERCFAEQTDVTFRSLSAAEIDEYVASGEPLDKAGAYGIQGLGGALVAGTEGDFDNVVGLPITRLAPLLRELLG